MEGRRTHEAGLLERSNDARLVRRGDDGHWVALILHPLQLLIGARALNTLLGELLRDFLKFTTDELVLLFLWHAEVVLLLQTEDHVAEVVAYEVLEEAINGVGLVDVVLLHDLVGEVGACFESETLRLAESVVTVEEDVFDLCNTM